MTTPPDASGRGQVARHQDRLLRQQSFLRLWRGRPARDHSASRCRRHPAFRLRPQSRGSARARLSRHAARPHRPGIDDGNLSAVEPRQRAAPRHGGASRHQSVRLYHLVHGRSRGDGRAAADREIAGLRKSDGARPPAFLQRQATLAPPTRPRRSRCSVIGSSPAMRLPSMPDAQYR